MGNLGAFQNIYVDTGFERFELYRAVNSFLHPREVLYAGSSIHITPSRVFQNVTYVDTSALAVKFFSQMEEIRNYVQKNCIYRQSPFIRFFAEDIGKTHVFSHESFDLAMSSYSRQMARHCWPYVRSEGHYLGNNHENDILDLLSIAPGTYCGYFSEHGGKYSFRATDDEKSIIPPPVSYKGMKSGGVHYLENERYYLLRKKSKTGTKQSQIVDKEQR